MYVFIHICLCLCVFIYVCMYVCMCLQVNLVYIYVYIPVFIFIYLHICIPTCVCVCKCIKIYVVVVVAIYRRSPLPIARVASDHWVEYLYERRPATRGLSQSINQSKIITEPHTGKEKPIGLTRQRESWLGVNTGVQVVGVVCVYAGSADAALCGCAGLWLLF